MKSSRANHLPCFVLAVILLMANHPSGAQDKKDNHRLWANIGLGLGGSQTTTEHNNAAFNAGVSYQFGANLLSARAAVVGEIFGDEFWDFAILYGRSTAAKHAHASISAGLGVVNGTRSRGGIFDPDDEDVPTTVGLALEGQLFWRPLSFLGIGIYGLANFNSEENFYGATFLSLQIGKLRTKRE